MKILQTEIKIGIKTPVNLLHVSDTHLTFADERDDARKIKLAEERQKNYFPNNDRNLLEIEQYAKKTGYPILHTGDLIDFVSVANLERVEKFVSDYDVFATAGNHEFSLYVGEAVEDAEYRNQSLDKVQASFKNDIRFDVKKYGEVKIIAIDNSYYRFDEEQYIKLKKELCCDEPVILMLHTPIFEKNLYNRSMSMNPCAYLVSVPEELMAQYTQERYKQQKEDEYTKKATELILASTNVKAILSGHLHYDYEGEVCEGIKQYITGYETMRKVTII